MKIRITGAQKETYWYAGMIGQIFETDGHICSYAGYRICGKTPSGNEGYVQLADCVIVMDEEPTAVTTLPDESLGGVMREHREVKRWANVGETVKYVWPGELPHYDIVTSVRPDGEVSVKDYVDDSGDEVSGYSAEAYVVLEPSDILVINSERFRMVDRKAAVGEHVIITRKNSAFNAGQVVTVHDSAVIGENGIAYLDGRRGTYNGGEYAVLEPLDSVQPTPALSDLPAQDQAAANIAALTLKVAELEKRADAAERRILALETETAPAYVEVARGPVKTPQEIRDEIVERAKADISDLRKFSGTKIPNDFVSFWPKTKLPHVYSAIHTVEFVVNPAKRTVVAIIRCMYEGLTTRGIAKCAPGDVFNAHIGRAIALHRALGLEVPAEYLNAPAPEDVRVGDVIKYHMGTRGPLTVRDPASNARVETFLSTAQDHFDSLTIIDDSREDIAPSSRKEAA